MTDYTNMIKLPKGSRTMSGEIIAGRHGSDIMDDLIDWLNTLDYTGTIKVNELKKRLLQIEKSYGIDRIE